MARLQQGSIVWATLPPPFGRRPVVVLTRDAAVGRLNAVTVAPVTRTFRGVRSQVALEPIDGVPTACVASLDNVFTIEPRSLDDVIVVLSREKMRLIFEAVRFAFDMP